MPDDVLLSFVPEQIVMATEILVELDGELARDLDLACVNSGQSRHEFVREALRRHIQRTEFEELSAELRPYAEAEGWITDDDIFRSVS
jgi:predicted transcriptional regulator